MARQNPKRRKAGEGVVYGKKDHTHTVLLECYACWAKMWVQPDTVRIRCPGHGKPQKPKTYDTCADPETIEKIRDRHAQLALARRVAKQIDTTPEKLEPNTSYL